MKVKTFPLITFFVVLALLLSRPATAPVKANAIVAPQPAAAPQAKVTEVLRSSPVMFIQNVGQFDERALFQVCGADKTIWFTEDAIWVTVFEKSPQPEEQLHPYKFDREARGEEQPRKGVNIKLSFPGSNPHPRIEPFNRLDTIVSYFISNDPAQWRANVPIWGGVRYKDLYPGIDLEIAAENGRLVQSLVAQPGADLSAVRLRVEGADAVKLAVGEGLVLTTAIGEFTLPLLTVKGAIPDGQPAIRNLKPKTFDIALPFSASTLLSPSAQTNLLYATFLGGSKDDAFYRRSISIAVDASGAAYITGVTISPEFPTTPGAYDTSSGGAFVVKLNPSGDGLAYATFFGGAILSIAVDSSGAAYLTGKAYSAFPATPGAYDTTYGGGTCDKIGTPCADAFVAKLNPSGTALVYATFLGGASEDYGYSIAVDSSGAAYVTGLTRSSDFPATPGAYDTTYNESCGSPILPCADAFVAKLNPSGTALVYATFLGGAKIDYGYSIAVDSSGAAYVTGSTYSSDFPTTPGAYDTTHNGLHDAFVVKLNPSGSTLAYATFLGGDGWEEGSGIAVDASGAAYVTGGTGSPDFPTTSGAYDRTFENGDAFVVKLNPSGTALVYATFLGGSEVDWGHSIAVDSSGAAYVTGTTNSSDFPTTPGAYDTTHSGVCDAFVVKLKPSGDGLTYATFLGGDNDDWGLDIAIDSSGAAYVTGWTFSSDFPTTPGAYDTTYNGDHDVFVAKLAVGGEVGPMPTKTPTYTPTPRWTPTRTTAPTATPPTFPTIPSGGLWIDNVKVTYTGPYPSLAYVTVVNRSNEARSGELVLKWAGKGMTGIVGRKRINLGPGNSASVEFDLASLSPKAELLRAEIEGHSYQTYLKTPAYPPSNEFSFLLYPSPENATELRVITPEGYVYTFQVKKVRISLDKSRVPAGFQWEKVDLYFFSRVSLEKCVVRSFLPWWIKVFQEDPTKVIAGEIVVKLVEEGAKALGADPIPVGKLLDVAETIKCTREGILVPLATDEPYLIIGKAVHLKVEYTAGTYDMTYTWKGRGEWSGYVNEATTQIRIPIIPYSYNSIAEGVKDKVCLLLPNLPFCATTKCEQDTHNGICYWEGFYVLNNQWGANKRPDCVKAGSYQRISTTGIEVVMDYDWANIKRRGCEAQVKGYPAIIAGWHYGEAIPEYPGGYLTPMGIHGLPAQINEKNQFPSGFTALREGPAGIMNLSWVIWIASDPQPQKPKAEIMIWPWYVKQQPFIDGGGRLKTITIGGMKWDLYRGKNPDGWWVYTFRRRMDPGESFTRLLPRARVAIKVNIGEFVQYLVKEGYLSNQDWIVGIEFGSQIIEGKGKWVISRYLLEPGGSLP